ncbi:unnamed protein product, partial [Allacma fusca]
INVGYRKQLAKVPKAGLHTSLDLWTSRSHHSVLGVRVHYIDEEWKLRNRAIGFIEFQEHKTADNVREAFKSLIETDYGIEPSQLGVVMTDNAAENVKAFDMKEFLLNVGPTVEPVSVEDYDGIP